MAKYKIRKFFRKIWNALKNKISEFECILDRPAPIHIDDIIYAFKVNPKRAIIIFPIAFVLTIIQYMIYLITVPVAMLNEWVRNW